MNNFNRDTLVEDFISNEEAISSISLNSRNVIDYYVKNEKNKDYISLPDIVWNIVKDIFEDELKWDNIDDIIYNIKENNFHEMVDWLIDIYDEDLINSYFYFDTDIDIETIDTEDDIIISIMRKSQYEWYSELFETIKNEFITFLEWLDS